MASDVDPETMMEFARSLEPQVVERIKASNGDFECPVCYDAVENPAIFVPCGHDTCSECYIKIKDAAGEAGEGPGTAAKCPNCRAPIDPKRVIDYETFKRVHLPAPTEEEMAGSQVMVNAEIDPDATESEDGSETESDDGDETESETESLGGFVVDDDAENDDGEYSGSSNKKKGKQPVAPIFKARANGLQFSDTESEAEKDVKHIVIIDAKKKEKKKKKSKKGKKTKKSTKTKGKEPEVKKKKQAQTQSLAELKKLSSRNKHAKKEYLKLLRRDFVVSAKITKTMQLLKSIVDETDEKIIIFSQWTSLLDLLEVPINEAAWKYQRYDGSMSARDRADAVDDFKDPRAGTRMMLVSLKAGNAGLNLNCASQVVILDPFWNPYIEEQAIDRAHRLGQERPVRVHRLMVADTVEDRIMHLQEQKRSMINEALDEGAGQRLSRLNQEQLGYLFGVRSLPGA